MKIAIIGSRGYPYVYSGYETFTASGAVKKMSAIHFPGRARRPENISLPLLRGQEGFLEIRVQPTFNIKTMNLGADPREFGVQFMELAKPQ